MGTSQPPRLRRHHRGQFFVEYAGRRHYLGPYEAEARRKYVTKLREWSAWKATRDGIELPASAERLLVDVVSEFLASYEDPTTRAYWQKHLRRFTALHGGSEFGPLTEPGGGRGRGYGVPMTRLVQAMADDLRGTLAPSTIRHDVGAVKRLCSWASARGYGLAVDFRAVETDPVPRSRPTTMRRGAVQRLITDAMRHDPGIAHYIAINYLCCVRPSEVVRLISAVHELDVTPDSGTWLGARCRMTGKRVTGDVYQLDHHKTAHRGGMRLIVVTPEARVWLDRAQLYWKRLDGYSAAARAVPTAKWPGPKSLERSAVSHLEARGATWEMCQRALGHALPGATPRYVAGDYVALSSIMARTLRLRVAPGSLPALPRPSRKSCGGRSNGRRRRSGGASDG
ncbi:MAG: hypothetical protein AAF747_11560 [Planctomycetota bacterium]